MSEVFNPRANMERQGSAWLCQKKDGNLICDGGPSIIQIDGRWSFYTSGIGFHRLNGPAASTGEWFIFGKNVTDEIHAFAEENDIDLENLSDEDKILIALHFS